VEAKGCFLCATINEAPVLVYPSRAGDGLQRPLRSRIQPRLTQGRWMAVHQCLLSIVNGHFTTKEVVRYMDQESFEQAMIAVLRQVPEGQRMTVLAMVQDFVRGKVRDNMIPKTLAYNVERHREIRKLTASIHGALAEAVAAERETCSRG
jgi:hypothetical protein